MLNENKVPKEADILDLQKDSKEKANYDNDNNNEEISQDHLSSLMYNTK